MNKLYAEHDIKLGVKAMKAIAEKWSPYRSHAVHYLLAWNSYTP